MNTTTRIPCETCGRSHRTWYNFAQCRFKRRLLWVSGNPPAGGPCFALVSFCRHPGYKGACNTVTLWADYGEALEAKAG
jgi:hypothetical protein